MVTQKAVIVLEVEKNERVYTFTMPVGSPFGEAYDVAFLMLQEVLKLSKEAVDRATPPEKEEKEEDKNGEEKEEKEDSN